MQPSNSPTNPVITNADISSSPRKKWLFIGLSLLIVICIVLVIGVSLGHKKSSPIPSKSAAPIAASPGTSTPVDKSFETDYGYKVSVDALVSGYISKHQQPKVVPYIIKLTISQTDSLKYTAINPNPKDFVIVADGTEITPFQYYTGTSYYELNQDGYNQLTDQPPEKDKPTTGYILFGLPKDKRPTMLRLKQAQTNTVSPRSVLPAKNYDIPL